MRDRLRNLRRPASTLVDQALVSVANFVTVMVFARSLSVHDFGQMALVLSVLLSLTAVQTAAVGQVHNVLGARRDGKAFGRLTGHLTVFQLGLTGTTVVVGLMVAGLLVWAGITEIGYEVLLSTLLLAPWLFQDAVRRFLYTKRQMGSVLLNDWLCYGTQMLGAILMTLGYIARTFEAAMMVYMTACVAGSVVGIFQLRAMGSHVDRVHFREDLREAWNLGKYLTGGETLGIVGTNATSWLLAGLVGIPALGAYRAATQIANGLNPLLTAVGLYMPALASSKYAETTPGEYRLWYQGLCLKLVTIVAIAVLLLALAAGSIVDLVYGTQFEGFPIVLILQISLVVRLFGLARDMMFHGLIGAGDSRSVIFDRVIQLVMIAVAAVPMVRWLEGVGVALWHAGSLLVRIVVARMRFQRLGGSTAGEPARLIGRGAEGLVTLSADGRTVRKRFTRLHRAGDRAHSEYRLLTRLSEFSHRAPEGVRAPRPVAFETDDNAIVMEYCSGLPLDDLLLVDRPDRTETDQIGRRLASGLDHFVVTTGEPYHDFCTQNILWDRSDRILTVLDIGNHLMTMPAGFVSEPYAISLGNYLGRMIYTAARPSRIGRFRDLLANVHIYRRIESGLRERHIVIRRRDVVRLALHRYVEMGGGRWWTRRIWYFTIGLPFMLTSLLLAVRSDGETHVAG